MEAKTILPQLNLIPIKIGNQTHEFYTDIDVESVRAFIAIWLLENKGTEENKRQLYDEVRGRILKVIDQMSHGHYEPNPAKLDHCNSCQWRTLCRAPHLN